MNGWRRVPIMSARSRRINTAAMPRANDTDGQQHVLEMVEHALAERNVASTRKDLESEVGAPDLDPADRQK